MVHWETKLSKVERVRRLLADKIISGDYRHGDSLPPEDELAAFFAVGRNTIRKAVAELLEAGLILKQQGRLSMINAPRHSVRPVADRLAWFNYCPAGLMNSNTIYFEMFKNAAALAGARGLQVDFLSTDDPECLSVFDANRARCAGMLSAGISKHHVSEATFARLAALPGLVAVDENGDSPASSCVTTDNYAGGRLAAAHLLQCGRRKLGFVNVVSAQPYAAFSERRRGFIEEAARHGLSVTDIEIANTAPLYGNMFELVEANFPRFAGLDAIFASTDELAITLITAARHHGVRVPAELAVIGFDGTFAGQHIRPMLTTIRQPLREIVKTAIDLALEFSVNPGLEPRTVRLAGTLMTGETTSINTPMENV